MPENFCIVIDMRSLSLSLGITFITSVISPTFFGLTKISVSPATSDRDEI
ncbi:MAG: hypothetical protein MK289_09130 [Trichodesmium sp. ALOHA_ZT_67]|nr:hypothetical protein [Trichodesmium sp. ALOHA_ZT_67]